MTRPLPLISFITLIAVLILSAACDLTTETPQPIEEPTKFAVLEIPSTVPTDTATAVPSDTATLTLTPTPTSSETPKSAPKATAVPPPIAHSGLGGNVWFMGPLIEYFSRLGTYPPEPAAARDSNVNPLTGLVVADPSLLQRRPILARLGNDPTARPHTGLNQADLVFEEIVDQRAGIFALTRLTAIFLGQNGTIRPFRSARPVNASLAPMFDGALAHSGASQGGRYLFSQLPWGSPIHRSLNLDDFFNGPVFCTIGSNYVTRFASTVEHIHDYLGAQKLDKAVPLRGFDFSPSPPDGTRMNLVAIDHLPWPVTTAGSVLWNYDAPTGRYLRLAGGVPHNTLQYAVTANWGGACSVSGTVTASQVSAANVIILNADYEPTEIIEDSNKFAAAFIELTGSGTARIFRDGVQINGTWNRPTLQHFFRFLDASGNVIPLKPGNTWFEIAPLGYVPTVK